VSSNARHRQARPHLKWKTWDRSRPVTLSLSTVSYIILNATTSSSLISHTVLLLVPGGLECVCVFECERERERERVRKTVRETESVCVCVCVCKVECV